MVLKLLFAELLGVLKEIVRIGKMLNTSIVHCFP